MIHPHLAIALAQGRTEDLRQSAHRRARKQRPHQPLRADPSGCNSPIKQHRATSAIWQGLVASLLGARATDRLRNTPARENHDLLLLR